MKIACMGNMNNNMFCIVRYLRDLGYDAHLFLLQEYDHFVPQADSYQPVDKSFVHELDWYSIDHWHISKEKIIKDLEGFNFFIGSDLVPAFFRKAELMLDIFVPHGGDLIRKPFYSFTSLIPKRWELGAWWLARQQRMGIKNNCRYFFSDCSNDEYERLINLINSKATRIFSNVPILYEKQYNPTNFTTHSSYAKALALRAKYDFIIFHQCRHEWIEYRETLNYKGNELLINAYAKFVQRNPELRTLLIMFEYGTDWKESKKLTVDLGIDNRVLWFPLMNRNELMMWASISDVGVGELAYSWFSYGSVFEMLTLKKPFIGNRDETLYNDQYAEKYPMVSAPTEERILAAFEDFQKRPDHYKQMGNEGYEWFMKYGISKPLDKLVEIIREGDLNNKS